MLATRLPLTPKSQILIWPRVLTSTLVGLTSRWMMLWSSLRHLSPIMVEYVTLRRMFSGIPPPYSLSMDPPSMYSMHM